VSAHGKVRLTSYSKDAKFGLSKIAGALSSKRRLRPHEFKFNQRDFESEFTLINANEAAFRLAFIRVD
jgi:hypothetical protein